VAPALAHHSFSMFDAAKKITLEGTIKDFEGTNPHSWILLNVTNATGGQEQWAIEMGPPSGLTRLGWVPNPYTGHEGEGDDSSPQGRSAWWPVHGGDASGRDAEEQRLRNSKFGRVCPIAR
jgi:hypothetical protein